MIVVSRKASSDELTFERDSLLYSEELIVLSQAGLSLFVHHQYELNHPGKFSFAMLAVRRLLLFCKSDGGSGRALNGFRPLSEHLEEDDLIRDSRPKRKVQSRWVRKRLRRNVTQQIYGSSYDHGMDDYR